MRCSLAAALGFTWLLLVPPLSDDVPPSSDPHAPLGRWEVESAHRSAGDCEEARKEFDVFYEDALMFFGVCVSDQDPRLKSDPEDSPFS